MCKPGPVATSPMTRSVREDSREVQRPENAWGRDVRLSRADDLFHVLFDARLIQPR